MRVVVDTNVFVYGIIGTPETHLAVACKKIIRAFNEGTIEICANGPIVAEYFFTMAMKAVAVPHKAALYLKPIREVVSALTWVPHHTEIDPLWIYDEDDKKFIECAVDGGISVIISEDFALKRFIEWNRDRGN